MREVLVKGRFGRTLFRGGRDWRVREGVLLVAASPIREMEEINWIKGFRKWNTVEFVGEDPISLGEYFQPPVQKEIREGIDISAYATPTPEEVRESRGFEGFYRQGNL